MSVSSECPLSPIGQYSSLNFPIGCLGHSKQFGMYVQLPRGQTKKGFHITEGILKAGKGFS